MYSWNERFKKVSLGPFIQTELDPYDHGTRHLYHLDRSKNTEGPLSRAHLVAANAHLAAGNGIYSPDRAAGISDALDVLEKYR